MLDTLKRSNVPIVVIDRALPDEIKARYVLSDHYTGIGAATRKLLKLGHRRLAVIVGRNLRPSRERVRAISDAYADAKLKPTFVVDWGSLSVEHTAAAVELSITPCRQICPSIRSGRLPDLPFCLKTSTR